MDYNEMLEILRGKVLHESAEATQERLNEIADAFEQTIRERDAAIADMMLCDAGCATCKHSVINRGGTIPCQLTDECSMESKWEWRGVQDEL